VCAKEDETSPYHANLEAESFQAFRVTSLFDVLHRFSSP
jgi:hypothetical protein